MALMVSQVSVAAESATSVFTCTITQKERMFADVLNLNNGQDFKGTLRYVVDVVTTSRGFRSVKVLHPNSGEVLSNAKFSIFKNDKEGEGGLVKEGFINFDVQIIKSLNGSLLGAFVFDDQFSSAGYSIPSNDQNSFDCVEKK